MYSVKRKGLVRGEYVHSFVAKSSGNHKCNMVRIWEKEEYDLRSRCPPAKDNMLGKGYRLKVPKGLGR